MKLLQSLNHPNIIQCYESFEHKGDVCLVLEYADNGKIPLFTPLKFVLGDLSQKILEKMKKNEFFKEDEVDFFDF